MQRATGRAVNVTVRGELLLDMSAGVDPRQFMGGFVVDARHRPVAKVRDVIGPVSAPVAVAAPRRDVEAQRLVGHELFLEPPGKGRSSGPRRHHGPPNRGAGRGGPHADRGGSSRGRGQQRPGRGGESRRRGSGAR